MKISPNGIKQIGKREGTILHGYNDSKGLLTIGVGHLVKPGEPYTLGGKITQAECDRLLEADLAEVEKAINALVKVPLTQNQYDALCSFVFNIGIGGFTNSSTLRSLNKGDYAAASANLMKWVKPPELRGRRTAERKQFDTPDAPAPAQSIQPVNESNPDPQPEPIESTTTGPALSVTTGSKLSSILGYFGGVSAIGGSIWGYATTNPEPATVLIICATVIILVVLFRKVLLDWARLEIGSNPDKLNVK